MSLNGGYGFERVELRGLSRWNRFDEKGFEKGWNACSGKVLGCEVVIKPQLMNLLLFMRYSLVQS